jgi:hypothetical protein
MGLKPDCRALVAKNYYNHDKIITTIQVTVIITTRTKRDILILPEPLSRRNLQRILPFAIATFAFAKAKEAIE